MDLVSGFLVSESYQASRLQNFCHAQLSMTFNLLINSKMPTIVGILTFISSIMGESFQDYS